MLNKLHISKIEMHSDDWFQARLARFTASEIYSLMGDKKPYGLPYIYRKVGEELSGLPARDEIDVEATRHGLIHETEALKAFGDTRGVEFVAVQKFIGEPDSRFSASPDGLIVHAESEDKLSYNVSPVEVKCPSNYANHVAMSLCNSPEELKKVNKNYYWQLIMQMYVCDSLFGYFVSYQPYFKSGGLKVIEFRKALLREEFKLMKERMDYALGEFDRVREILISQ